MAACRECGEAAGGGSRLHAACARRGPSAAAAVAAAVLGGLVSCYGTTGVVVSTLGRLHDDGRAHGSAVGSMMLLVPFVVGGVVAGCVYRLMSRRRAAGASVATPIGAATAVHPSSTRGRVRPSMGADPSPAPMVFAAIVGSCTAIGATLGAWFLRAGGDSGTASGWDVALSEGAVPAGLIGLGMGLLIAVPAALVVAMTHRAANRRR
jgi:hypothetical protein